MGGGIAFVVGQPLGILGGGRPVPPPGDEPEGGEEGDLGRMLPVALGILAAGAKQAVADMEKRPGDALGGEEVVEHHQGGGDRAAGPAFGFGDRVRRVELPDRLYRPEDRVGWSEAVHRKGSIRNRDENTSRTRRCPEFHPRGGLEIAAE